MTQSNLTTFLPAVNTTHNSIKKSIHLFFLHLHCSEISLGTYAKFTLATLLLHFTFQSAISNAGELPVSGELSLIAGNILGAGARDGLGTDAQFSYATSEIGEAPKGIALDRFDNLYVADVDNHTIRKITPEGLVTTIAGKAGVHGSSDGPGSVARFYYPTGIAVDTQGNLYVADSANYTIRKITPDGVVSTLAGLPRSKGNKDGKGPFARFRRPERVAVSDNGIVYVADTFNNAIRVISPEGEVTTVKGKNTVGLFSSNPDTLFAHPSDVMLSLSGDIYVADADHDAIRVLRSDGVTTLFAETEEDIDHQKAVTHTFSPIGLGNDPTGVYVIGRHEIRKIGRDGLVSIVTGQTEKSGYVDGPGSTALFSILGNVAVDKLGNLFVADGEIIRRIAPAGMVTTFAGQKRVAGSDGIGGAEFFSSPNSLATDQFHNLYVVESVGSIIHKIDAQTVLGMQGGSISILAGHAGLEGNGYLDGPIRMAKFNGANEIVADENCNFYVSDFHNNVIRKISRTGMVTTITGTPGKSGSVDGAGSHAKFNGPTYMAADKAGNLFVWDSGNRVIRKISRAAVVTTLAGYVELKNGKNDGVGQSARFESVTGMTIDQLGNLFVTDGSFIRKVSPAGEVKTIGDFSEKLNDIWTAWPTDIAADGLGNLYFVLNETVRKLTPLGQTTILAGIPNRRGIELGSPGVLDRPHGLIVLDDETLALISGNAILKLKVH